MKTSGRHERRIIFVTTQLNQGGMEQWLLSLTNHLPTYGVRPTQLILTGSQPNPNLISHQLAETIQIIDIETATKRQSRNWDAAIVTCTQDGQQMTNRNKTGSPTILVSHGSGAWTHEWVRPWLPHSDKLTAVSAPAAQVFRPDNATIIANGAELNRATPTRSRQTTRTMWGVTNEDVCLLYLGRYSDEKTPLAAARAARELGPPYRSIYHADGHAADQLIPIVREIDPGAVIVDGNAHVGDSLEAADAMISASPSEGHSLAINEAWLAGCPVASTNVGAIPELTRRHGQLVTIIPDEPTDSQLAAAAARATHQTSIQIAQRAYAVTHLHYTAEAMARRWASYIISIT